jgi:hypothetical protein
MSKTTATDVSATTEGASALERSGSRQAYVILRSAFTVAPILFGVDKFFDVMADWGRYLAPPLADLSPLTVATTMHVVGVVEVLAGVLVAVRPRLGAPVVAAWLAGIIVNLLVLGGHLDIALRDFGLMLAAIALFALGRAHDSRPRARLRGPR